MKNAALIAVIVMLGLACPAQAGKYAISPADLLLQERLETRISCEFAETSLAEVVEYLRVTLQVNIVLSAPFEVQQFPVTLSLKDVTASTILRHVTRQIGLQYVLANGVVFLATPQDALWIEPVHFKHYDVTDLLAPVGVARTTGGGATSTGGALSAQDAQALVEFLVQCTGPENWDTVSVGGTIVTSGSLPAPNSN